MKNSTKTKVTRPHRRASNRSLPVKGDIARAMFARWEKEHLDPHPVNWEDFKAKLESNRLRRAPLFSK